MNIDNCFELKDGVKVYCKHCIPEGYSEKFGYFEFDICTLHGIRIRAMSDCLVLRFKRNKQKENKMDENGRK